MQRLGCGLATFVALSLLADGVFAQERTQNQPRPGGPGDRPRFVTPIMGALDADGDGTISAKEIEGAAAALKKLDKDGDGNLSGEEIRPSFGGFGRGPGGAPGAGPGAAGGPGGGAAAFVARMMEGDKNKDGKLTKDELSERQQGLLERADTNKDGALDQKELEEMSARFFQRGPGGPGGRRPGGEGGESGNRPRRPE
jgi:hypothetical protein